jgi:hypothetical protein
LIGAAVSILLGVVATEPSRYAYWLARVRPQWLLVLCFLLQAATYAGAAMLVAALADSAGGIDALGTEAAAGLLSGLVPHGLAAIPLPPGSTQDLRNPKSWLGKVLNWIKALLDYRAGSEARAEIIALTPERLIERTWDLYWNSYWTDASVKDEQRVKQEELLRKGQERITSGKDVPDGIGSLRNFCIGEIKRRFLGK